MAENKRPVGIIIPARNEAECIGPVLRELQQALNAWAGVAADYPVAVGVNATTDETAAIVREMGVICGETSAAGYGHGCQAAIDALRAQHPQVQAFIFMSADGANDPADLPRLLREFDAGYELVMGCRTICRENYLRGSDPRRVTNFVLGAYASFLSARIYRDLGPYRLISRDLFDRLAMSEFTWGWTIEPQIKAARLGARTIEIPMRERPRLAGQQKVSGVSWRHSINIASHIFAAGWRARFAPVQGERRLESTGIAG